MPPPTTCVRAFGLPDAGPECTGAPVSFELIGSLFLVSLRSVLTVAALASVGALLRSSGSLTKEASKFLATLSSTFHASPCAVAPADSVAHGVRAVNVSIPALLFSEGTALNASLLRFAWPLLLLPTINVGIGLLLGSAAHVLSRSDDNSGRSFMLCACAFGNSTGLPLVLLTLIRDTLLTPALRAKYGDGIDPLSYLPLYLLTYPLLQWTVGASLAGLHRGGQQPSSAVEQQQQQQAASNRGLEGGHVDGSNYTTMRHVPSATRPLVDSVPASDGDDVGDDDEHNALLVGGMTAKPPSQWRAACASARRALTWLRADVGPQLSNPPVMATLAGAAVAFLPKGVTTALSSSLSPLGWVIPAAKLLAGAAVPVNLLLLGANLQATLSESDHHPAAGVDAASVLARLRSVIAIGGGPRALVSLTFAKLVLHPFCGAAVCAALRALLPPVPDPYDDAFWLTALLMAATPTANNVLVMVAAAGGDTKRASAAIAAQYVCAPVLLTFWLSLFLIVVSTVV